MPQCNNCMPGFKCCRLNRGLDCSPRLHVAVVVLDLLHGSHSFYNTIAARLIHIVFKFAIVFCTCIYSSRYISIATFYKLHSFCNTIARAYH